MNNFFNKMGGRKLIFAILLTAIASLMLWFDKSTTAEWREFMIWIYGTYAVGNVGEHLSGMMKKG